MFTIFSTSSQNSTNRIRYRASTPLGDMELTVAEEPGGQTLISAGFADAGQPGVQKELLNPSAFRTLFESLPCQPGGTPFQTEVWQHLAQLSCDETLTYSGLARVLGKPTAQRAVAGAVARNPIAIRIPCHRVVPAGGGTGGFRWGEKRKIALIEAEKRGLSPFDFLFETATVRVRP